MMLFGRTVRTLLLLSICVTIPLSAHGQKKKSRAVKAMKANMGKKKVKVEEQGGPASLQDVEQAALDAQVKVNLERKSAIRADQIGKMERLLRDNPHYHNKVGIYHRLAEANWQESKYRFLIKMDDYRNQVDAYDAGTLSREPRLPKEDYEVALEFYRRIQRQFPDYFRIDEVTYYLAKGLLLEGKNKKNNNLTLEGVSNLLKVVNTYPKSRFVAEAYLALAEYYFDRSMLTQARLKYEQIINNHKRSSMYNYALYKLAWVYYNQKEMERSVKTFKKVVKAVTKSGVAAKIEFRDQALNDLVRVYAEMDGGWKLARKYFLKQVTEDDTYVKLKKLGGLLLGMDRDEEAISLYEHFLKKFPRDKDCIVWWDNILSVRVAQEDLGQLEKDTRRMVAFIGPKGTWRKAHSADDEVLENAYKLGEGRMMWIANQYHREAQRLRKQKLYFRAADLYELFLREFNDSEHAIRKSKNAYMVNFYLAEILSDEKKDYKKALVQYERVLERDRKGEYTEDAALGAVYCYYELMYKKNLRERPRGGKTIDTVKLSEEELKESAKLKNRSELAPLEKGFVDSADAYVNIVREWLKDPKVRKKNPKRGERIPEMMFVAAEMLYNHGQYEEAVARLKIIFEDFPRHEFAAWSVQMLIDCYAKLAHWEKVENWSNKLIKARNFKVLSRKTLNKFRAIAVGELAREHALKKEYSKAISQYKRVYKEFRRARNSDDKELAANAIFNIAAIHYQARDIRAAIKAYRQVRKEFPSAEKAPEAQYLIGEIYESQTQFVDAARSFLVMEKFKSDSRASDAILNAGLIYEAVDRPRDAIKTFQKYLKLFPKKKNADKVYFRIGRVHEDRGGRRNLIKAKAHYTKFIRRYASSKALVVEAHTRVGAILRKLNEKRNRRAAEKHYAKAQTVFAEVDPKSKGFKQAQYFAAQAKFEETEYVYSDYEAIALDKKTMKKIEDIKERVTNKAQAFKKVENSYLAIMEVYKQPQWNAAALFRTGMLYYNFVNFLLDAPIPDGLDIDTEDAYRLYLEQQAKIPREKSLVAFGLALKSAHQMEVYNDWSKKSAIYAAKVNPEEYPVSDEKAVRSDHTRDTLGSASLLRYLKRNNIVVDMAPAQ